MIALPASSKNAYPLVEQMQECLGHLHDSDIAIRRLEHWRGRQRPAARRLAALPGWIRKTIESFQEDIATQRRKFRACWRRWLKADVAAKLEVWLVRSQRGELVSIAGNDNTAPAGRDGLRSAPGQETVPAGGLP